MRATVISLSGRIATVRIDGTHVQTTAALIKSVVAGDVVQDAIAILAGDADNGYILIGIIG